MSAAGRQDGPLSGVRVLDLSQMLAGPICGMRLGDLGADVIKVEPPGAGEWTRTHGFAQAQIAGETTAQLGLNRNKRSVTLNLKDPDGLATFFELVKVSDVVLQNFRVGTVQRPGVDWPSCHAVNPHVVYCSISGYGATGPLAGRPGQDLLQGYSGSMLSVGRRDDPPQPGALWAPDVMTGYQAAIGILAALRHRDMTGTGQHVEVDMLSVVMDAQSQELATYLNLGIEPTRTRTPLAHAWMNAPYGVYRTSDGWVVLAMTDLARLGAAMGSEWLTSLTSWDDGVVHRDAIYDVVAATTPSRTTGEWLKIFDDHNLEMALFCDVRIATPGARFTVGEIKLGWHGGAGETQLLPRLVGYGTALEMLLIGDPVPAEEAARIGLVQRVVPAGELTAAARAMADRIAANPPSRSNSLSTSSGWP